MRLPGEEEETGEKMRLSVCRKWLLAAAASVSVNSNKKLMSDCHRWLSLLSLCFQSGQGNLKQRMFMLVMLLCSAKAEFPRSFVSLKPLSTSYS